MGTGRNFELCGGKISTILAWLLLIWVALSHGKAPVPLTGNTPLATAH